MKEGWHLEKYNAIEVPEKEVREAIRAGIRKAGLSVSKKKRRKTGPLLLSAAAAALFLASGIFLSPVADALAKVPFIGQLYGNFDDLVGKHLESQQLITRLNQSAADKGIKVKITSAYYDGAILGATFDVNGKVKGNGSDPPYAFYEIFGGDERISDSKELVRLEPKGKGFTGHIRLYYPASDLPENATFPLAFKAIGETEGAWKFNVPVEQLPYEKLKMDKEVSKQGIRIHFDSMIVGKASTAIDYTAIFPKGGEENQVRLEIYDDDGEIKSLMDGIDLEVKKEGQQVIVKGRTIILQPLNGDRPSLTVYPKVALAGEDPNQPLELEPFRIDFK